MHAFSLDLVRQAFEKTATDAVPRKLLLEADADPRLRGYVHPDDQTRVRVPIKAEGRTVGFYTPRKDGSVWRTGAIYVKPAYRGKGLASAAIAEYMRDKKGSAFIEDGNDASRAAFVRAGFVKGKRDAKEAGYWYDHHPDATVTKVASKFAKYIRSAPEESLWSAVPRILNTAGPQQFGMPLELSQSLQDLHVSRGLLDREQLLKGLRKRFESENDRQRLNATGRHEKDLLGSAGTPSKVVKDSDSLAFARAVPQNAKSETVRLMHSNDSERIRGIMEHGPSLRMDKPAQGAYGKERFGLFAHFKDNPEKTEAQQQQIRDRARYYANQSAAKGGGHPATLEFDFPKELLRNSQDNSYEPVVPQSLWRYAKNFSVRSEPWTGGGLMGRGVDSMQHLSGDKMQRIYDMEPGIPDIAKTRPAGIRRMEEDAAAALRNRNK